MNSLRKVLHKKFSLKLRSAVAISKACWYHHDVNRLARNFYTSMWLREEMDLSRCLSEFNLPENLRELLLDIIHEIGSQIQLWITTSGCPISVLNNLDLSKILVWSDLGVIDQGETTQNIIQNCKDVPILARFTLACNCNFPDRDVVLNALWDEIKEHLGNRTRQYFVTLSSRGPSLQEDMMNSGSLTVALSFLGIAPYDNYPYLATENQFPIILRQAIEKSMLSLVESVLYRYYFKDRLSPKLIDPLSFSLIYDLLNESIFKRLLERCPSDALASCLQWPLYLVYNDIARCFVTNLSFVDLHAIIFSISSRAHMFERKRIYYNIFVEFYTLLNVDQRSLFVKDTVSDTYFADLFRPNPVDQCFAKLLKDPKDKETLERTMVFDGIQILNLIMTENKFKATKALCLKCLGAEKLVINFDSVCKKLCKQYLEEYYGE